MENQRMAKIDGNWQRVELVWGDCDTAVVLLNGNKITVNSGLLETVASYERRMQRQAAVRPIRLSTTDKTLVIDPDMIGTY